MRAISVFITCILALSSITVHAQSLTTEGLPDLDLVLLGEQLSARGWLLDQRDPITQLRESSSELAANGLRAGIAYRGVDEPEARFIRALGATLAPAVNGFIRAGGYSLGIYTGDNMPPIRFFNLNGQPGVLFSSIGIDVEFNTARTTELERMRQVVFDMMMPKVSSVGRVVGETELRWMGISMFYGISDFTSDRDRGEVEAVIVLFPMWSVNDYRQHAITDVELVLDSLVFGSSGMTMLRRISLYR